MPHTDSSANQLQFTHEALNRLQNQQSLYLRQHATNPVNWYPWGDEALTKARDENKLILLSIGYASCHWCHVMEHESFENDEVASVMNHHYVSIKVDREERPDIDAIYMEAVQMMTGHGGWPLNVWLTPDLVPIYGGTYFPLESNHHRPGFIDVLVRMAEIFQQDPDKIAKRSAEVTQALTQEVLNHVERSQVTLSTLKQSLITTQKHYEPDHGGFSNAPKFPSSMHIEFLMRFDKLVGDESARTMALYTLRKMCLGGIYDQLGGGFHRYSTDKKWLVPHFEKMLYDNALLISALCDAWQVSKDPLFEQTLTETIAFIKRDLTGSEGEFYASIDADSGGEEGIYYIWSYEELKNLIDEDDFPEFSAYYDVFPDGNWEGNIILNRTCSSLDFSILTQANHDEFCQRVEKWRTILMHHRSERVAPVTDQKVITSWNAMLLKSLCKYWFLTGDPSIHAMIIRNAEFLVANVYDDGDIKRVAHQESGFCDDYATLSEAFQWVFKVTGNEIWLQRSVTIANKMILHFYDEQTHAFHFTHESEKNLIVRKKDLFDNVTPSANSAAIAALFGLGRLTGDSRFSEIADLCIESLGSILSDHALSFSYLLQIISDKLAHNAAEIVILGTENDKFLDVLRNEYSPFTLVVCGNSFETSDWITLKGKVSPSDGSHAYVCKNFACHNPEKDIDTFRSLI